MKMAENKSVKQMIGKTFMEIADAIQTGQFGARVKIGLTTLGSELGIDNLIKGAELAAQNAPNFDIVLIGPKVETNLEIIEINNEDEMHKKWKFF